MSSSRPSSLNRAVHEHHATTTGTATSETTSPPESPAEVIARNLNALFDQNKRSDGRKITNQDVAKYVTHVTGHTCHRTWIAKLRDAKLTAPDLVRLDAVAKFFGHTRTDLVNAEDRDEPSHDHLRGLASLAERLETHGVNLAQLASLDPDDLRQVSILVRRLANNQESQADLT